MLFVKLMGAVLICWDGGNPWNTKSGGLIFISGSLGLPRCLSWDAELYTVWGNTVGHGTLWESWTPFKTCELPFSVVYQLWSIRRDGLLMSWYFPEGSFHRTLTGWKALSHLAGAASFLRMILQRVGQQIRAIFNVNFWRTSEMHSGCSTLWLLIIEFCTLLVVLQQSNPEHNSI